LLALRDGKIEIQFKNEFGTKVTSGGKAINDGLWHIVSWSYLSFPSFNPLMELYHMQNLSNNSGGLK